MTEEKREKDTMPIDDLRWFDERPYQPPPTDAAVINLSMTDIRKAVALYARQQGMLPDGVFNCSFDITITHRLSAGGWAKDQAEGVLYLWPYEGNEPLSEGKNNDD